MTIEKAIKLNFKKFEDGRWRRPIERFSKGKLEKTWQSYLEKMCKKCGNAFLASHKVTEFCGTSCFLKGNDFSLGTKYKRENRPEKIIQNGYAYVLKPGHPKAIKDRIAEHRKVIEEKLGRELLSNEIVHHINGNRSDNRLENLVVLTHAEHNTIHKKEEAAKRPRAKSGRFI